MASEPTLRAMLAKDFGLDLPISGGFGGRDDPILVHAGTPAEAALAELRTLTGIGRGRGVIWRSLGAAPVMHDGGELLQRKIEVVEIEGDQRITTISNFYFRRVGLASPAAGHDVPAVVHVDAATGLRLPFELGPLHHQYTRSYAPERPDLGHALAYGGPGVKATLYLYPAAGRGVPVPSVADEVASARQEFLTVYGADAIGHDWPPEDHGSYTTYAFIPRQAPGDLSVILVGRHGPQFVKLRVTIEDQPETRQMLSQAIEALPGLDEPSLHDGTRR